jgi:hypothetical protein
MLAICASSPLADEELLDDRNLYGSEKAKLSTPPGYGGHVL